MTVDSRSSGTTDRLKLERITVVVIALLLVSAVAPAMAAGPSDTVDERRNADRGPSGDAGPPGFVSGLVAVSRAFSAICSRHSSYRTSSKGSSEHQPANDCAIPETANAGLPLSGPLLAVALLIYAIHKLLT